MKIIKNELVSIEDSDIKKGVLLIPKKVNKIADEVIINLPQLQKVIARGVTAIGNDNFRYCNALTALEINNNKLKTKKVDNTIFVIESEKSTKGLKVYSGYNFISFKNNKINKEVCFVAEKDGFHAHGLTVKKAISDVQFKVVSEKLKNEPISENTVITVNHYRLITGACEFGVNNFITSTFDIDKQKEVIENGILAKDLLPILEKSNAYGVGNFKKLVTF